jgi:hypothetical protein
MTRQYLQVLQIERQNGLPEIVSIRRDGENYVAYVKVKDHSFYMAFTIDCDNGDVMFVDSSPQVLIHYSVRSDTVSVEQLKQLTHLSPTNMMKKGDSYLLGLHKKIYEYNGLEFSCSGEPGEVDEKLRLFLSYLSSDADGIKSLVQETGENKVWITVIYHIGTGMFSGLFLTTDNIKSLANLDLEVVVDLYAVGNPFISET